MDIQILLFFQSIREALGPGMETAVALFSDIITNPALYVFFAALYWCVDKKYGRYVILSVAGGTAVNQLFKNIACVYRPWIRDSRIIPAEAAIENAGGYSFPSGHSMQGMSQSVSIAKGVKKKSIKVLLIIMAILIGISRLYLCVHTPQDVIVGLCIGAGSAFACFALNEWIDKKKNNDIILMIAGIIIGVIYLLFITLKSYPMDYAADGSLLVDPQEMMNDCYSAAGVLFGFVISIAVERHFINFEIKGTKPELAFRFLFGLVMMLIFYVGIKHPVYNWLGPHWGRFALYGHLFVVGLIYCPLVFKFVHPKFNKKA